MKPKPRLDPARFVKPAITTYAPSRLFALTCDYERETKRKVSKLIPVRWHLHGQRRNGIEWGPMDTATGTTGKALWKLLRSASPNLPRAYIVAEDGAETITSLGFFAEVKAGRFSLQPHGMESAEEQGKETAKLRPLPLTMGQSIDCIGARWETGNVRIISPKNHALSNWLEIAANLAQTERGGASSAAQARRAEELPDAAERAAMLLAVYKRYCEWWIAMECGPWSDSSAGLGYSWWRRTVSKKSVLVHDWDAAHAAECESVFGGRAQTFFFGRTLDPRRKAPPRECAPEPMRDQTIHSELTHVDVRSMYVSIMREQTFPTKILAKFDACDRSTLRGLCDFFSITARCLIDSRRGSLPCKVGKGIAYPRGMRIAWLTTPEIIDAHAHGEILECHGGWKYQSGKPLARFASEVLRLREVARIMHCPVGSLLAKTCGNAFSGRLARRRSRWIADNGNKPPEDWCWKWIESGHPEGPRIYRSIAGRSFWYDRDGRRIGGLTAIYAHLTAYGRVFAARILAVAGWRSCVSWDTDGGWFTAQGIDNLRAAGLLDGAGPGTLRIVETARHAQFRTPKHSWIDGRYMLSGIRGGFTVDDNGRIEWEEYLNAARQAIDPTDKGVSHRTRTRSYETFRPGVPVGDNGWADALVYRAGELIAQGDSGGILD